MATIYIVDDRPINRQFLVTLLGYSGHTLAEAGDGAEALALVQKQIPDLIILDIVMPNMDGKEFVTRLQSDPRAAAIPVIFYTATYRNEEAHSIARSCGVRWVLPKPSDPQIILKVVTEALGGEAQQDAAALPPSAVEEFQLFQGENDLKERMTRLSNQALRQQCGSGEPQEQGAPRNELQLIQMQAMTLKLVALVEAGIDIGVVRDPARLVELYCRAAQDILTARYAAIRILDESGGTRYFALKGIEERVAASLDWGGANSGAFAQALEERRPVRMAGEELAARAALPPGHPPVTSIIVVPLLSPERNYGWLYVADRLGFDKFCMDDERIAVTIGAQFSLAFENIDLCERVQLHACQLQRESLERLQAVESLRQKEQMLIHQSRQAAMGEMINNIAHQWRQPLNTLGLMIQYIALTHRKGAPSQEKIEDIVHKSMQLISHMSQTIDDFRNFFRPDKEMVIFKVNQVLGRAISLIEGSFNELGVKLETATEGNLLVFGYPNEYAQVLLNILANARDALAERQVSAPRVSISAFAEKGNCVVTIRDNAGGIPDDVMPRIFEPYFTTKGETTGTGVGLFMSKTIIEQNMEGTLSARNTEDGVEFRIVVRTAMAPLFGES